MVACMAMSKGISPAQLGASWVAVRAEWQATALSAAVELVASRAAGLAEMQEVRQVTAFAVATSLVA